VGLWEGLFFDWKDLSTPKIKQDVVVIGQFERRILNYDSFARVVAIQIQIQNYTLLLAKQ